MSDTPRTDAAYFASGATMYDMAGEMKKLERELNEANADRLRLRTLLAEIGKGDWRYIENGQAFIDINQALTTPPPPVVAKADADALAEAVEIMRVGVCSAAMPNATEREIASDAVNQASKVLKTYRNKYKEGKQ
jgi:hypothetical protein